MKEFKLTLEIEGGGTKFIRVRSNRIGEEKKLEIQRLYEALEILYNGIK